MQIPECLEGIDLTKWDVLDLEDFAQRYLATGKPGSRAARKGWRLAKRFVRKRIRHGLLTDVRFRNNIDGGEIVGQSVVISVAYLPHLLRGKVTHA